MNMLILIEFIKVCVDDMVKWGFGWVVNIIFGVVKVFIDIFGLFNGVRFGFIGFVVGLVW